MEVTTNTGLSHARSDVFARNGMVRYQVGTRGPRGKFEPDYKEVAELRAPNNTFMEFSATVCRSCFIPPCCSSVVNGLVIRTEDHTRTVEGVGVTLSRLAVSKVSVGHSLLTRVLSSRRFIDNRCAASFVTRFRRGRTSEGGWGV